MDQEPRKRNQRRAPGASRARPARRSRKTGFIDSFVKAGRGIRRGRRQDVLGGLVLLIGVLLVLGVILLAMSKTGSEVMVSAVTRFGEADIGETEGFWHAFLGDAQATLQAEGEFFQIIVASDTTLVRRFVRGTISEKGDYLIFTPRSDLGRPQSTDYTYYGLASGKFVVHAKRNGERLVWKAAPAEHLLPESLPESLREKAKSLSPDQMRRQYGLVNPLFELAGKDYIVWEAAE